MRCPGPEPATVLSAGREHPGPVCWALGGVWDQTVRTASEMGAALWALSPPDTHSPCPFHRHPSPRARSPQVFTHVLDSPTSWWNPHRRSTLRPPVMSPLSSTFPTPLYQGGPGPKNTSPLRGRSHGVRIPADHWTNPRGSWEEVLVKKKKSGLGESLNFKCN